MDYKIQHTNTRCTDNQYYFCVIGENNKTYFISRSYRKATNWIKKYK